MPELWQWIFAITGLVAFLMAVPSFLQMFVGGPKVVLEYRERDSRDYHFLECAVFNKPVSGLLRLLGVRREAVQDMVAEFQIVEKGSGSVIIPITDASIKTQEDVVQQRVFLAASLIPVTFSVVCFKTTDGQVLVVRDKSFPKLQRGSYIAGVTLVAGGKCLHEEHTFNVDDTNPYAYWVKSE